MKIKIKASKAGGANKGNQSKLVPGEYVVLLRAVYDTRTQNGEKTLTFYFEAACPDDERVPIGRTVNLKDDMMLPMLIHALSGKPIPESGIEIDTDLAVGRCCRVTIETRSSAACESFPIITEAAPLNATDRKLTPKMPMNGTPKWIQKLIDRGTENEKAAQNNDGGDLFS